MRTCASAARREPSGYRRDPIVVAVTSAFAASFIGLLLSYYANLPTGPAIILTSGTGYIVSMLIGVQGGLLWQLAPRKHLEA
jgi:zinc/manganese transport system permease protein